MIRPDWDAYFLGIAGAVALRADCTRRQVGAVITQNHRIVSTGYNGAPAGQPGCLSGACPRGEHARVIKSDVSGAYEACSCGYHYWPCPESSTQGTDYSNCISIHAEANALLYANRADCQGATIYITHEPCPDCTKLIRGAGIIKAYWPEGSINDASEARAA